MRIQHIWLLQNGLTPYLHHCGVKSQPFVIAWTSCLHNLVGIYTQSADLSLRCQNGLQPFLYSTSDNSQSSVPKFLMMGCHAQTSLFQLNQVRRLLHAGELHACQRACLKHEKAKWQNDDIFQFLISGQKSDRTQPCTKTFHSPTIPDKTSWDNS